MSRQRSVAALEGGGRDAGSPRSTFGTERVLGWGWTHGAHRTQLVAACHPPPVLGGSSVASKSGTRCAIEPAGWATPSGQG